MFRLSALCVITTLAACAQPTTGDGFDRFASPIAQRTADEEAGLVAFLNDYEVSTLWVLDYDCGLRSDSAANIDEYRTGPDGHYGNGNDQTFTDQQSVDDIYMVGDWTLDRLYECAMDYGYIEATCDQPGVTTEGWWEGENWRGEAPAKIVAEIDQALAIHDWCMGDWRPADPQFISLTITYEDCESTGYEVELWQIIDNEYGIAYSIFLTYDANGDLWDAWCWV